MWGVPSTIEEIFDDNKDLLDPNGSIFTFSIPVVSEFSIPVVSKFPTPKAPTGITQTQKQKQKLSPSTPSMMTKAAKGYIRTRFMFFTAVNSSSKLGS